MTELDRLIEGVASCPRRGDPDRATYARLWALRFPALARDSIVRALGRVTVESFLDKASLLAAHKPPFSPIFNRYDQQGGYWSPLSPHDVARIRTATGVDYYEYEQQQAAEDLGIGALDFAGPPNIKQLTQPEVNTLLARKWFARERQKSERSAFLRVYVAFLIARLAELGIVNLSTKSTLGALLAEARKTCVYPPGLGPSQVAPGEGRFTPSAQTSSAKQFFESYLPQVLARLDTVVPGIVELLNNSRCDGPPSFRWDNGRSVEIHYHALTTAVVAQATVTLLSLSNNEAHRLVETLLLQGDDSINNLTRKSKHGQAIIPSGGDYAGLHFELWTSPALAQLIRPRPTDSWESPCKHGYVSRHFRPKSLGEEKVTSQVVVQHGLPIFHVFLAAWCEVAEYVIRSHANAGPTCLQMKPQSERDMSLTSSGSADPLLTLLSPGAQRAAATLRELHEEQRALNAAKTVRNASPVSRFAGALTAASADARPIALPSEISGDGMSPTVYLLPNALWTLTVSRSPVAGKLELLQLALPWDLMATATEAAWLHLNLLARYEGKWIALAHALKDKADDGDGDLTEAEVEDDSMDWREVFIYPGQIDQLPRSNLTLGIASALCAYNCVGNIMFVVVALDFDTSLA